jgi:hypothetical protein
MLALQRNLLLLGMAMLAVAVGLLDALAAGIWDLAVVLTIIGVVLAVVIAGLRADRRSITIRPDLAAWIRQQAAATGEPVDRLADRAVAAYLTGLSTPVRTGTAGREERR